MPLIREAIVTTVNAQGEPHIAPSRPDRRRRAHGFSRRFILRRRSTICARRRSPSRTSPTTCASSPDASPGGATGRLPPLRSSPRRAWRRRSAHLELVVVEVREHELRPRFVCRVAHRASHAPFQGFNRAQAAVIEGAVLVSRLHMLPRAEVEAELARLEIIVGKTAGAGRG